jgi:capsular exopolysaccharide synthesis family protein
LQRSDRRSVDQIAANPDQEKYLLTVGRQQKIKEALYLFLLQKREENELSRTFTAQNVRILTPPTGNMRPISPRKNHILLLALALGLLIPTGVIFARENSNTKVRGRKDLEVVTVPFIGEVPLLPSLKKKKSVLGNKTEETRALVVKEGSRDIINEAFRVLRTNLEFMSSGGEKSLKVIAITSFNPGSGKSFIAMNLGACLAIKDKKVLVIDGDLRHGTASSYVDSPKPGLSEYLNGSVDKLSEIIVTQPELPYLDIIPIGTVPPNPTELLFSDRLKELIDFGRARYDYVLIDCPPVEIVADTQIIEKLSDRTVFVVRAGLLERSMLPELEKLYNEHKFKNMAMILNGVSDEASRYGYHYGYRYGYQYGYGKGYHYGSDKK